MLTAGSPSLSDRFTALSSAQRVDLMRALVASGRAGSIPRVVPPRDEPDAPVRLSPAQEDLWVYESLYPGSPALNLCCAYHFDEPVDRAAMTAALESLRTRHDVLRARISGEPGALWLSFPDGEPFAVERTDLSATGGDLDAAIAEFRSRPFVLHADQLFRACLVTVDERRATLVLSLHHIIADWWSFDVLQRDFAEAYLELRAGRTPQAARPAVQYADFASWQGELDAAGVFADQLGFWRRHLAEPPPPLRVPGTPAGDPDGTAQIPFRIGPDTAAAVRTLARARNSSVYAVLMAAFAVLAHRLTAAPDLVLGTPVANRWAKGLDQVIGYVMNAVPTRWRIRPGDSFDTVLGRFLTDFPEVLAHSGVPVGRIVSATAPERTAGRSPLFQWVFMHLGEQRSVRSLREFARPERVHTGGEHDLMGVVWDDGDGMRGSFEVRTGVCAPIVVARWADAYTELLGRLAAAPDVPIGRHDLVPAGHRAALVRGSRGPAPESLPEMVARHARTRPTAVALTGPGMTLTYRELDARVDGLAGALARRGAAAETVVALALGRTADLVVALLAVQRAGAAHLPVDRDHPADHLRAVLAEAAPVLVITDGVADLPTTAPQLTAAELGREAVPWGGPAPAPAQTAYLIHTSGSTGRPKGVAVPHTGIAALAEGYAARFGLGPADRVLQLGAPTFDISIGEVAMAFGVGATLVVAPAAPLIGPELGDVLRRERITATLLAPSVLATVPAGDFPDLRVVVAGAETCPPALVARWATRDRDFHNAYGPTEATVGVTASGPLVPDGTPPCIGAPIPGTRAYVLDSCLRPAPVGVRGELYLAGDSLARGYPGRPALTADRFVADPFGPAGARMYRTGDLARWREDGGLDHLGRIDDQVKLRGLRVEPAAVAAALAAHPDVADAVVLLREDRPGHPRLVGYAVAAAPVTPAALLEHLAARLPAPLVPADVVVLDAFPLQSNGKVDRRALPAPGADDRSRPSATEAESRLCALVAEVLAVDAVGPDDDFFRLGGDSIMAIQLASRAPVAARLAFAPRDVFTARTPARLARLARTAADPGQADPGTGRLPLTPVMRWWRDGGGDRDAFTQSMVFPVPAGTAPERVAAAVRGLTDRHGALRMRLVDDELEVAAPGGDVGPHRVDASAEPDLDERAREVARGTRIDPEGGAALRATWLDPGPARAGRLVLTVHHLAVDVVSWRILGPELAAALVGRDEPAAPGTSFRRWAHLLAEEAVRPARARTETAWWERTLAGPDARVAPGRGSGAARTGFTLDVTGDLATAILIDTPAAFDCGADAVMLTALTAAVARWRGEPGNPALLLSLEGHGRDAGFAAGHDVLRTVGWFTALYPLRLDLGRAALGAFGDPGRPDGAVLGTALRDTRELLAAVPDGGIGWGLLRYLNPETAPRLAALPVPDVCFNYLGRLAGGDVAGGELIGAPPGAAPAAHALEIEVVAVDGADHRPRLLTEWSCAGGSLTGAELRELARLWRAAVEVLTTAADPAGATGYAASDFPLVDLSAEQLAELEAGL